jgi:RNA polymerase sigma-B factor
VFEAMEANRAFSAHTFDAPTGESGLTLAEGMGDLDPAIAELEHELVANDLLATLPDRERVIVQLRFFDGLTQSQIAARVGVSQMHVSRLLARALETLRARLGDEP